MSTQLGPSTNGFLTYDVSREDGVRIGELIVTGSVPGATNVGPLQAAWSWNPTRTEFPSRFRLTLVAREAANAADGAWLFVDAGFPDVPTAVDPTGFLAHAISRTDGGAAIGHLFNRRVGTTRQQFWSTDASQIDPGRRFKNRDHLFFTTVPSAVPGPIREITTFVPPLP